MLVATLHQIGYPPTPPGTKNFWLAQWLPLGDFKFLVWHIYWHFSYYLQIKLQENLKKTSFPSIFVVLDDSHAYPSSSDMIHVGAHRGIPNICYVISLHAEQLQIRG